LWLGKVVKTFLAGDERMTGSAADLKLSVEAYNNVQMNINFRIVIKSYELLKGASSTDLF